MFNSTKIKKKLLFFGDLPPKTFAGTSISSSIILTILKERFNIIFIYEDDNFKYKTFLYYFKLFNIIKKSWSVFYKSLVNKIHIFYLVLSVSKLGSFKTMIIILSSKLGAPKSKIYLHIHRGDFFTHFYTKRVNRIITKIIFFLTDTVVVLSESQKNEFNKIFKNINIVKIANTVDIEPTLDLHYSVKKNNNLNNFIFLSNYFEEKGIFDLLDVFTSLQKEGFDIELDTYGRFPSDEVKEKILKYETNYIRIHGIISGEEKHEAIRKSKALILPSWNEGQPLVILEAMVNATPVIATNVGLIPEMVGDDYSFLLPPRDKDSLRRLIKYFLKNDNHDIGVYLRNRYFTLFSKEVHKRTVLETFK